MQSQSPDPIACLWTAARAMFARMRAALGEVLAARERLSLDHKHAVRCWLAPQARRHAGAAHPALS